MRKETQGLEQQPSLEHQGTVPPSAHQTTPAAGVLSARGVAAIATPQSAKTQRNNSAASPPSTAQTAQAPSSAAPAARAASEIVRASRQREQRGHARTRTSCP